MQPLPPTTNSLQPSQRARLLKSTRKLTDVLGATPHVLDTDLSPGPSSSSSSSSSPTTTPVHQKRQGVQFYSSPNTASTSFISLSDDTDDVSSNDLHCARHRRPTVLRQRRRKSTIDRPLVLRLHSPNTSRPSYAIRLSITSLDSPLSSLFAEDSTERPDSQIRRKRMAKLAKTLGENVPSDLLLSQCTCSARSSYEDGGSGSVIMERRRSVSSVPNPFPIRTSSLARSASTTTPKSQRHQVHRRAESEWNGEWSIEDSEKRAKALRNLRSR